MRPAGLLRHAVPYLVLLALVGVDVATGPSEPFSGTFGAAALVAAALGGPRTTAVVAGVVAVTAVLSTWWEVTTTSAATVRIVIVVACCLAAVALAAHEQRRDTDYAQVRAVADAVQRALLRPVPASAAGVQLAARYVSAARFAQVGGDFYEVVPWGTGARLVVGDVRGKGLDSVGVAAVALGAFREAAAAEATLGDVAVRLDTRLREYLGEEDFVTAVLGELHGDGHGDRPGGGAPLRLLSCGHPAPLLVRGGEVQEVVLSSRPPLGLGEPAWWPVDVVGDGAVEVVLVPGDRVLLYTDGLLEARDLQRRFVPLQRLAPVLVEPGPETPGATLDRLLGELTRSTGGVLGDDLALLLLQRPSGGAGELVPVTVDGASSPARPS